MLKNPQYKKFFEEISQKAQQNGEHLISNIISNPKIIDSYVEQRSAKVRQKGNTTVSPPLATIAAPENKIDIETKNIEEEKLYNYRQHGSGFKAAFGHYLKGGPRYLFNSCRPNNVTPENITPKRLNYQLKPNLQQHGYAVYLDKNKKILKKSDTASNHPIL